MSEFQRDAAEIIDGVADYIDENGWTRGALHGPGGTVCILGGISEVRQAYGLHTADARLAAATEKIQEIIGEETHHRTNSIPSWNDRLAENSDEVVELLRFAAADMRADDIVDSELWDDEPEEEIEDVIEEEVPDIVVPDFVPADILETADL